MYDSYLRLTQSTKLKDMINEYGSKKTIYILNNNGKASSCTGSPTS